MNVLTPRKRGGGAARSYQPSAGNAHGGALPPRQFPGRRFRLPRRLKRTLAYAALTAALLGLIISVAFAAWVSRDLPNPDRLSDRAVAQSTKIYARDGTTLLYEIHGEERRTLIELDQIGKYTKQATLAIEDRNFYKHRGVSLRGTVRAILVDLTSGSKSQGGSTITQQLVKNAILTREKSVIRKVKEWILSYQIERRFTKDQILKLYFNEIPYGANAYGIEAAAQTYFNKSAKELDLAESALLTAVLPAPSYYSPRGNHPDELLRRWRVVLDEMVKEKYITRAQADGTKRVNILARVSHTKDRVRAPHFVFYVRDLLEEKYGTAELERGGLKVVTTLDPELQTMAEEEVAAGAVRNEKYGASNAALVAIEPKTGQVLALVGSRDYFDTEHDGNFNVTTALRNPGSSFKPVVYLTAFMKGYTPDTVLFDLKTDFGPDGSGKNFAPNNYDAKEHGPLKMRQTLAGSLNIPAVKTLYLAGIPQTVETATKLGYTSLNRSTYGLALAIGGGAVRLIEHVGAFATLANDGVQNPTATILRVENGRGKVLDIFKEKGERAVPEQPVRQLVDILSDNGARAFIFGSRSPLVIPGRPMAAKTGTTNDFKDGWTVGFTKQLAAGVWVGNNDNTEMHKGSDGVVVAAPIWNAFMRRALEGDPIEPFTKPKAVDGGKPILNGQLAGERVIYVDKDTGKKIPDSCLSAWPEAFVAKKSVKEVHTILYYLDKDDPRGAPPKNPDSDPMFARWEKPVQEWAKKNGYLAQEPAEQSCSLRAGQSTATATMVQPEANATLTESVVVVEVALKNFPTAASATFYVDDVRLATKNEVPFTATLDLSGIENGFRTIRVVVTDGTTTTEARLPVNILTSGSAATLYFLSPENKSSVSAASFPRAVTAFAYDPAGVTSVTLSLRKADGETVTLDTAVSPPEQTVTLSWPTTDPGTYQLILSMRNKKGITKQSDALTVTVTP